MTQVVEHLPSKHEANTSTTKKKKRLNEITKMPNQNLPTTTYFIFRHCPAFSLIVSRWGDDPQ
jgi:hypothetical protein